MNKRWMGRAAVAAASIALAATMAGTMAGTANAAPGQGGCLRPLIEAGTISQAQADELHDAIRALRDSGVQGREAHEQGLAGLVADGSLTQAQADAIVASKQASRGPRTQGRQPAAASSTSNTSGTATTTGTTMATTDYYTR